jgi:hypothetical protein
MKKIILLFLSVLAFNYGQCQQTENVALPKTEQSVDAQLLTNPAIEVSSKTTAMTFEPEMTATAIEPKTEMATATKKASFKERMMTKYISRQIKKSESNTNPKAEKTNTIALIAGIAGIVSVVSIFVGLGIVGLLAALAAIIMGFIGKGQINDGRGSGKGWAITGIVGGILYFFLLLLAVVFVASLLGGTLGK